MSVTAEEIKIYLEGRSDEKYITSIESDYFSNQVTLVINSPTKGKYTKKERYKPFLYPLHIFDDDFCCNNFC